uniref:Uncharacterized protein n=1 Tax=Engystomops pustulosus TaxID=76066 RepID=A0AAV6YW44_ENGPU|nr:hypothetical protein GDO81_028750 [Engystomops pustulosus]
MVHITQFITRNHRGLSKTVPVPRCPRWLGDCPGLPQFVLFYCSCTLPLQSGARRRQGQLSATSSHVGFSLAHHCQAPPPLYSHIQRPGRK